MGITPFRFYKSYGNNCANYPKTLVYVCMYVCMCVCMCVYVCVSVCVFVDGRGGAEVAKSNYWKKSTLEHGYFPLFTSLQ